MHGAELRASTLVSAPVTEVVPVRLHIVLLTLADLPYLVYDFTGMGRNLGCRVLDMHEIVSERVIVRRDDFGERHIVQLADGVYIPLEL
tara:strand:+ start:296 stop:562 length:267 start_codon:yes stop_codon:yes gene_type:complete